MVSEPSGPSADTIDAARGMLGALLCGHGVSVRLTEVEAYAGPADPASHAFRRTPRSAIMYGPPGRLYVYRIHGHHCANIVTGDDGVGSAVLLRAGEIVDGVELARSRRPAARKDVDLARGPGRLAAALGLTMADLDADVFSGTPIRLEEHRAAAVEDISAGPRVGVRLAADRPWRFWITGDPTVSAYRRHPRAQS